jgi:hypothetical protein
MPWLKFRDLPRAGSSLLSELSFGTLVNYSPRGSSVASTTSQRFCGGVKAGRLEVIRLAIEPMRAEAAAILRPCLNSEVTLVPIPRSAPLSPGALWPAKVLADFLVAEGFGGEVLPCLRRTSVVPKSAASSSSSGRPLVQAHYASLEVDHQIIEPAEITLVDDVVTLGRTALACAQRLREAFPNTEIRLFAMMRTLGLIPEIERVVDPCVGTITGYPSGRTHREP